MHFCKLVILLAAAFSFGIFLDQQGQPTTFSTPSASAKSTATTSSSNNLNNIQLEDAKQDLDWATADASDEKTGAPSACRKRGGTRGAPSESLLLRFCACRCRRKPRSYTWVAGA